MVLLNTLAVTVTVRVYCSCVLIEHLLLSVSGLLSPLLCTVLLCSVVFGKFLVKTFSFVCIRLTTCPSFLQVEITLHYLWSINN